MENKFELIPASELPVAEGNEVDVLCVENGELKRKEGASLDGGVKSVNGITPDESGDVEVSSGNEPDLIIEFDAESVDGGGRIVGNKFTITKGSIQGILEACVEHRRPTAKVVLHNIPDRLFSDGGAPTWAYACEVDATVQRYGETVYIIFLVTGATDENIYRYVMVFDPGDYEHAEIRKNHINLN